MARIAIAGFMHETNCFVPDTTDFENFANPPDRSGILRGERNFGNVRGKGASTAGFLNGSESNHEIAPCCGPARRRAAMSLKGALSGSPAR